MSCLMLESNGTPLCTVAEAAYLAPAEEHAGGVRHLGAVEYEAESYH